MVKWQNIVDWAKEHKKEIAAGCLSVAGIGLCYHYRNEISGFVQGFTGAASIPEVTTIPIAESPSLVNVVEPVTSGVIANSATNAITKKFDVSKHLRNLPAGRNPSPEKVATALANGFNLRDGQTWVDSYVKGAKVA